MGVYAKIKILVVFYSQTGQLGKILNSVMSPLSGDERFEVTTLELKPETEYPFPWSAFSFFSIFPECFEEIPVQLKNFQIDNSKNFDLIILGYQPWFLSPSLPVTSFLQAPEAGVLFKNKPVITVLGCRNMWLMAQEKLERRINGLGGSVKGKVALSDRHGNIISLFTVIGWLLKGKKKNYLKVLPESGVSETDISESSKFGELIRDKLISGNLEELQHELIKSRAIDIQPKLYLLEKRGSRSFSIFARFIRKKGGPEESKRNTRLRLFMYILPPAIILLSPITTIVTAIIILLNKKKLNKEIKKLYYPL